MATEIMGLLFEATSAAAWLVWILPFAAALLMPAIGKFSKKTTGYVAVAFALMSALSAVSLFPVALEASEIHHQINWIESIGL
jgi:NADH-quinone oxidoreductase subunit L